MAERHKDDRAVNRFARAMREKMAQKRSEEGYSGWDDPSRFPIWRLKRRLAQQIEKGNMVNAANFCMMIWNRTRKEQGHG